MRERIEKVARYQVGNELFKTRAAAIDHLEDRASRLVKRMLQETGAEMYYRSVLKVAEWMLDHQAEIVHTFDFDRHQYEEES